MVFENHSGLQVRHVATYAIQQLDYCPSFGVGFSGVGHGLAGPNLMSPYVGPEQEVR